MKIISTNDWYQCFKGNPRHLPASQRFGIQIVQRVLVPIQAVISLISGKYSGDVDALKFYASSDIVVCESCCKPLTRSGGGHDKEACALYRHCMEVLMSDQDEPNRRLLQDEKEKLMRKLTETTLELERIDEAK